MSDLTTKSNTDIDLADIPGSALTTNPIGWFDHIRDWFSDRFSSIMVKEARQSLKSYQFFITYTIVIFAVATWTVLMFFGDMTGGRGNAEQLSESLFYGYCVILGVPLCLVVPFSAFRSLAREYEDGTIQLISITTMKPYQIVLGKLSTSLLQMVIYLSVIAPCIALTYMLDGISYPLIAVVLLIAVGGSIFLTILGLLLAGASRSYALSMGISVFFVLGLGLLFIGWWNLLDEMITGYGFNANDFESPDGQLVFYLITAFLGSTALVMLTAAGAQISFESDNRSTATRVAMLIQLTLFFGLIVMFSTVMPGASEPVFAIAIFAGHFWLIVGCMLVSEKPGLSDRVQRTLPKTWLGRSFFSLLMPGPGRGYLFTVSCLIASILATFVIAAVSGWLGIVPSPNFGPTSRAAWGKVFVASVVISLYPLFFLSLTYFWMSFLRKFASLKGTGALGPLIGLISGALFVFALSIFTYTLWYNFERYPGSYYSDQQSFLGCFNWYVGLEKLAGNVFNFGRSGLRGDMFYIYFVPFAAVSVPTIISATVMAIRELRYQPTAAPARVNEEIERAKAERYAAPALPAGESIDEIFGVLPDRKEADKGK